MTDTTDIAALREAAALIAHGYKQRWGCEKNEDTGFFGVGTFDHDGDLCPFIEVSVSNWSDEDGDDERLAEFLTLANPVAILALLDQLEAERQRADRYHFVAMSALEAQAEISEQLGISEDECDGSPEQIHEKIEMLQTELAALKGNQVPVEYQQRTKPKWDDHHPWSDWEKCSEGTYNDLVKANLEICDWIHEVRELFTAPQKPVEHPDTRRMDWLCAHTVQVRDPMLYGSHAMFWSQCDSDDCEEHHTKLREQVDAAIESAGGIVKDGE